MSYTVAQVEILGETVIPLPDGNCLVASKSRSGSWYFVEGITHECSCKGYVHSKKNPKACRHSKAVIAYNKLESRRKVHENELDKSDTQFKRLIDLWNEED